MFIKRLTKYALFTDMMITFQFREPLMCFSPSLVQYRFHRWHALYLKLCMFVDVLCSLSVQDELSLVGNPNDMVLHGMAEQPLTVQREWGASDSAFLCAHHHHHRQGQCLPLNSVGRIFPRTANIAWQDHTTLCLLEEQSRKQNHLSVLCCKAAGQWQIPL